MSMYVDINKNIISRERGRALQSPRASQASKTKQLAPRPTPPRSAAQRQQHALIRSVHTARFKMMQVVAGVAQFLSMTILQVLWAEFLVKLRAAESLDDLREGCDQYANKVCVACARREA